jgi:hypothetical protein
MAAAALTPRVRMMAICDGVRESKTEVDVFHLKGVRQEIMADAFPFVPRRLWLFFVLSSPRAGEFPGYLCVVNEQTDKVVLYGHIEPRPIFDADGRTLFRSAQIACSFPQEGWYTVQVWFFQQEGTDVLKGETPFYVALDRD